MFVCLEKPVLECTCTFSVCSQHYNQVLSNPILYSQSALCNHYETAETRNQSSHHSFCTRSRSHADNSLALVSVSTLLFLAALNLLFPQDFLRVFLDFLSLFISSLTQCPVLDLDTTPPFKRLFPSLCAERVREHQPHHVGGQPAAGVGSLRLPADQADLRPAGEGVEGLCRGTG